MNSAKENPETVVENKMHPPEGEEELKSPKGDTAKPPKPEATENTDGPDSSKSKTVKKGLSELEKYWQAVKDNPADFTGWTYLLQFVEQENDLVAARKAFDSFFKYYPYCYGYWKKYADMEKKWNTAEKAEEVFEQGLKAIPLSVDLWIHYLNFYKSQHKKDEDYYTKVKVLFERAVDSAGQEFRSDRLWDLYINWELENKHPREVTQLYDKLLNIPTQLYVHHFEKFQEHIKKHLPKDSVSTDEFLEFRKEFVTINEKEKLIPPLEDEEEEAPEESGDGDAGPPGDEAPPGLEDPEQADKEKMNDEETKFLREKIIEKRKEIFKKNEEEVGKRWNFEEGIKRPYFHVKPLERAQLKNWREYLDFEAQNSTHERTVILFERCMIACALYEDMWMKYARYMEKHGAEAVRDVYRRACTIHLPRKPNINLSWEAFEERHGNYDEASKILLNLEINIPDLLEAKLRRINVERRRKNYNEVETLYKECIEKARNTRMASHFAVKYARFCYKVKEDYSKATEVLNEAVEKDGSNPQLHMQLVDVGYQQSPLDEDGVIQAFDKALNSQLTLEQKLTFCQRKLEFLEDFGSDSNRTQEAFEEYGKLLKTHIAASRKRPAETNDESSVEKKAKSEINGSVPVSTPPAPVNPPAPAPIPVPAPVPTQPVQPAPAPMAPDPSAAYGYHQAWPGAYPQNPYNYQQPWTGYHPSYYPH